MLIHRLKPRIKELNGMEKVFVQYTYKKKLKMSERLLVLSLRQID